MKKFIGFGDMLVSFTPDNNLRFVQAEAMNVNYTGAEANVCVSLSNFGVPAEFVTKLPQNAISNCAEAWLRKYNVGTNLIAHGGERIGVIYTEKGASQRPSKVVYDRKYTSIATAVSEDFDWEKIFQGADWFHFTGITAALSDSVAEICEDACRAARKLGMTVSCDLNYRKNLWTPEKAKSVMSNLVRYVDVLIANEEDAEKVLGIKAEDTDVINGKLNRSGYVQVAKKLCETYGVKKVGITLRQSISASDNNWSAMLYDGQDAYFSSKEYHIHIVNRVGGGDSFSAGLIYALGNDYTPQKAIDFATAASCLKHTIEGDFNLVTVDEVELLVGGDGSGRVQR